MQLWFKAFINLLGFKIHFASKLAFGNRFGFKTCKSLGGEHRLFAKPQVFPSYNLPIPWQALTFGEIFIYCNDKAKAGFEDILQ